MTKNETELASELLAGLIAAALLHVGRENQDFWKQAAERVISCNKENTPQLMKKVFEDLAELVRTGPHGRAARASAASVLRALVVRSTVEALKADDHARIMLTAETKPTKEQFHEALDPILDYRCDMVGLRLAADILEKDIVDHLDGVKAALDRNAAMGATMCMLQNAMVPTQDDDSDDGEDEPCH